MTAENTDDLIDDTSVFDCQGCGASPGEHHTCLQCERRVNPVHGVECNGFCTVCVYLVHAKLVKTNTIAEAYIVELKADAETMALSLHHEGFKQGQCLMCGAVPRVGAGHSLFCLVKRYSKTEDVDGKDKAG